MDEFEIAQSPHNKPVRMDFSLNEVGVFDNDSLYQEEANKAQVVDELKLDDVQINGKENGTFPAKQDSDNQELQKQESNGQQSSSNDKKNQDKKLLEQQQNKPTPELRFDDVDYEQNIHCLLRIVFVHLVMLSVKIKRAIVSGCTLGLQHLPKIKERHKLEKVTDDFYEDILMLKATNKFQVKLIQIQ